MTEHENLTEAIGRLAAVVLNLSARVEHLEKRTKVRNVSREGVEHLFEGNGGLE